MLSDRTYRKAWREKDALKYIQEQAGRHFDPEIVKLFFKIKNTLDKKGIQSLKRYYLLRSSYNTPVPTPFYHISIAEELLASDEMPESVRAFLLAQRGAFLLGKTAPDVQTLSGQARSETHFYHIPLRGTRAPWEKMFTRYRSLGCPASLSSDQAAFISGYICHLQADVIWITDLFVPYFVPMIAGTRRKQVGYLHNALRSYLDALILEKLPQDVGKRLADVNPSGWLPFVQDRYLAAWRDYLAQQLIPGAKSQTVEVFASRLEIPIEEFLDLIKIPK